MKKINNINKMLVRATLVASLTASFNVSAVLGPIPIYLNTEYRTSSPVIGSIASTISFDSEDIKQSGANTFGDFLLTVPNIEATNPPGSIPSVYIRGNEGTHTLLLVNGVKVANGGYANLDAVPLNAVEKVEIIKGPFSSLYGPGAIGGIISVITNKKQSVKSGNLNISYGSHNTKNIALNASNRDENGYINIALSEYSTDGINAITKDTTGEKDGSNKRTMSISAGSKLSEKTDIEINILNTVANIRYDDYYSNIPVIIASNDKPDNNLSQFNLKTTHEFSKGFISSLDIRQQDATKQEKDFELFGITLLNEYNFNNSKLSFGLENETDKAITDNRVIKHNDIFAQYQTKISNNDFVAGFRNVNHDKFGKHNTYNFGWGKDVTDELRLNFAFGKATNLPNHFQSNINITNNKTDLKPEHSKSVEFGIDYKDLSVKLYKSKTRDAFDYLDPDGEWWLIPPYTDPDETNNAYINENGIENQGVEVSYYAKLFDWGIDSNLNYNKSIDSETKKDQGRRPDTSLNIVATRVYGKFNHKVQFIAKSKTWDKDNEAGGKNSGYALLNLGTNYKYNEKTNISFNISNAFDKNYTIAEGYNQLGRTFNLGLSYKF
jgi:vitamin B12 transporter